VIEDPLHGACRQELRHAGKGPGGHRRYASREVDGNLSLVSQIAQEGSKSSHQQPRSAMAQLTGVKLQEACDIPGSEFRQVHLGHGETVGQKLLNKWNIVQQAGLRQTTLLKKVAPVLIDAPLLAIPRFWRPGRCKPNFAQHRQHPSQRRGLAAMNDTRIASQKSFNFGIVHLVQVELPCLEPVAEPGDA